MRSVALDLQDSQHGVGGLLSAAELSMWRNVASASAAWLFSCVEDSPRRYGPDVEITQHAARGITGPEAAPAIQLPWVHGQGQRPLTQLPQHRAGNRLKIRVPSVVQSLFGWLRPQVFTGRMISVGTPSASYRTLWSGSGVALRRIRRTPF